MVEQQIFAPVRQVMVSPENTRQWYNDDGSENYNNNGTFFGNHFSCILSFGGNIATTYIKAKSEENIAKSNTPPPQTKPNDNSPTENKTGKVVLVVLGSVAAFSLIMLGLFAITKKKPVPMPSTELAVA